MRTARPLGLTGDGKHLMVVTEDGLEIAIPADDRLKAALRADSVRLGQLEIEMDSALRPRDIQARIRAGQSPEDVARAAGVPVDRIDAFAAPVIAEREHVAGLAQTHPVRRRGETTSHRNLRNAVADALAGRGIDADTATWDAWKVEDRRWRVALRYRSGSAEHEAHFLYDQSARFTTADNDEARWLIGEESRAHGPQPGRRRPPQRTPEPGLADDDLAIVRALQSPEEPEGQDAGAADTAPAGGTDDTEDAYHPGELTEVDGVYEIVPVEGSDMDVLYDMLSSFDEDSVRIYAGLIRSEDEAAEPPTPPVAEGPGEPAEQPAAEPPPDEWADEAAGDVPEEAEPEFEPPAGAADLETEPGTVSEPQPEPAEPGLEASAATPEASLTETAEPEQLSLIDEGEAPAEPVRRPRRPRKKRAQVPSWDEIMFGGPREGDD